MSYTELRHHLWLATPKGEARAIAVIDYGPEDDLIWVCICTGGEIWCWANFLVTALPNKTYGRNQ